jgi:hypothetical protein
MEEPRERNPTNIEATFQEVYNPFDKRDPQLYDYIAWKDHANENPPTLKEHFPLWALGSAR